MTQVLLERQAVLVVIHIQAAVLKDSDLLTLSKRVGFESLPCLVEQVQQI